jgi:hypothetical protein
MAGVGGGGWVVSIDRPFKTLYISADLKILLRTLTLESGKSVFERPNNSLLECFNSMLRIRDVYPGSRILIFVHPGSRIPDPKTATKDRGEKKFVVLLFFVATKVTKLKIILILSWWRKILGQFTKNYRTFYPKNCH